MKYAENHKMSKIDAKMDVSFLGRPKTTGGPYERRHFEMESGNFQLWHEPFQECHGRSTECAKM